MEGEQQEILHYPALLMDPKKNVCHQPDEQTNPTRLVQSLISSSLNGTDFPNGAVVSLPRHGDATTMIGYVIDKNFALKIDIGPGTQTYKNLGFLPAKILKGSRTADLPQKYSRVRPIAHQISVVGSSIGGTPGIALSGSLSAAAFNQIDDLTDMEVTEYPSAAPTTKDFVQRVPISEGVVASTGPEIQRDLHQPDDLGVARYPGTAESITELNETKVGTGARLDFTSTQAYNPRIEVNIQTTPADGTKPAALTVWGIFADCPKNGGARLLLHKFAGIEVSGNFLHDFNQETKFYSTAGGTQDTPSSSVKLLEVLVFGDSAVKFKGIAILKVYGLFDERSTYAGNIISWENVTAGQEILVGGVTVYEGVPSGSIIADAKASDTSFIRPEPKETRYTSTLFNSTSPETYTFRRIMTGTEWEELSRNNSFFTTKQHAKNIRSASVSNFFRGLLDTVSPIATVLGTAVGGPALGGAISAGSSAIRSLIPRSAMTAQQVTRNTERLANGLRDAAGLRKRNAAEYPCLSGKRQHYAAPETDSEEDEDDLTTSGMVANNKRDYSSTESKMHKAVKKMAREQSKKASKQKRQAAALSGSISVQQGEAFTPRHQLDPFDVVEAAEQQTPAKMLLDMAKGKHRPMIGVAKFPSVMEDRSVAIETIVVSDEPVMCLDKDGNPVDTTYMSYNINETDSDPGVLFYVSAGLQKAMSSAAHILPTVASVLLEAERNEFYITDLSTGEIAGDSFLLAFTMAVKGGYFPIPMTGSVMVEKEIFTVGSKESAVYHKLLRPVGAVHEKFEGCNSSGLSLICANRADLIIEKTETEHWSASKRYLFDFADLTCYNRPRDNNPVLCLVDNVAEAFSASVILNYRFTKQDRDLTPEELETKKRNKELQETMESKKQAMMSMPAKERQNQTFKVPYNAGKSEATVRLLDPDWWNNEASFATLSNSEGGLNIPATTIQRYLETFNISKLTNLAGQILSKIDKMNKKAEPKQALISPGRRREGVKVRPTKQVVQRRNNPGQGSLLDLLRKRKMMPADEEEQTTLVLPKNKTPRRKKAKRDKHMDATDSDEPL